MVQSADHFESFEPHTLLKHAIYRAYVERWARILGWWHDRLRIVDACAGTGADESGKPGSPLIAVVAANEAAEQMTRLRGVPVSVEVLAIEKDARRFAELVERFRSVGGRQHRAQCGTLADCIGALEQDFARVPTLFFIDPFGLEPLRAEVLRRALRGPKNEVFLLFADQAALRHVGVVDAVVERAADTPELDLFGPAPAVVSPASEHTHRTSKASVAILDAVFGGDSWRPILELPRNRRQAFVDLFSEMLKSFGARNVLALPIYAGNTHKYHLIYATRAERGYGVMKEAVEAALNKEIVMPRTADLIRLGTQTSEAKLKELILETFAGNEVPWSSKDRDVLSVWRFALEYTPAMPSQRIALRESLSNYQVRGSRAIRYRFPPRAPR